MDVKLIVVSAKTGTKEIFVKRPRILGRAKGIGIVIPHPTVSQRHCLLFDNGGLLMIQDLNSAQGTFVGGRKIIMAPLPPGAEFTVGPLTFRAEYAFSGSLDALPKTFFDEPEAEPVPTPLSASQEPIPHEHPQHLQGAAPVQQNNGKAPESRDGEVLSEPSAAAQEIPSFFGFESQENFPTVVQPRQQPGPSFTPPAAPIVTKQHADNPADAKKHQPPMPPPLPKVPELPGPGLATGPSFGDFAPPAGAGDEVASTQAMESEGGIPGLNVDSILSELPPVQQQPPLKKKVERIFSRLFQQAAPAAETKGPTGRGWSRPGCRGEFSSGVPRRQFSRRTGETRSARFQRRLVRRGAERCRLAFAADEAAFGNHPPAARRSGRRFIELFQETGVTSAASIRLVLGFTVWKRLLLAAEQSSGDVHVFESIFFCRFDLHRQYAQSFQSKRVSSGWTRHTS